MTTVISVENLSKSYHLGQIGTGTFSRDLEVWSAENITKSSPMQQLNVYAETKPRCCDPLAKILDGKDAQANS